jgi:uncharacterized MAPEG superfamily protein
MGFTTELTVLGWSILVFLAHMIAQGAMAIRDTGLAFNAGPRDALKPLGHLAGRAQRAFGNFKETWPVFIALALGLAVTGRSGGVAAIGAWVWLCARIVYLPLYLAGVPWLRTLAFGVSIVGLAMMFGRFV